MITASDLSPEMQQRLELAYTYKDRGEFEEALRECDAILREHRLFPEVHNLRGMILERLGRKSIAVMAYQSARNLDPNFAEAAQNLARLKSALTVRRVDVKLSTLYKVLMGGMMAFFFGMAGMFVWMAISFGELGAFVFALVLAGIAVYLWMQPRRWPRVVDEEGITKRNGHRVLWRDLTKVERITAKLEGVRVSGALRLYFKGDEVVDITPNGISPSAEVVKFVAQRTRAYPG